MAIDPRQISAFPQLRDLQEAEQRGLSSLLQSERYRSGAQVCREGDEGDAAWFLAEGKVVVSKQLPDGRRVKLAELPAGTMFGQAGLIRGQRRTAEVRAEGDVVLLRLPRGGFEWSLERGQPWAVRIQQNLAVDLVRQLRSALDKVSELARLEDPSLLAEGKTRDQIPRAQSLEAVAAVRPGGASAPSLPLAAVVDRGPSQEPVRALPATAKPMKTGAMDDLLRMLQETEAELAGSGFDPGAVEFVMDEDQRRTADARRSFTRQ
jgi:CRP-like cAMP-binding protein